MPQARKPAIPAGHVGREGNRWVGNRPTGEEFADWFRENVYLDPALGDDAHQRYVGGIVLISGKEKRDELDGEGRIVKVERLVHTPYPKVDTRELYFWDVCEARDWLGEINPVTHTQVRGAGLTNVNLPPGFFRAPVVDPAGKIIDYVGCTMRVSVTERDVRSGDRGRPVRVPPPMSKTLPSIVDRWGNKEVSEYLLEKCATGAIGRALGAAGFLVIPGSGIATAEDMQEVAALREGDGAGAAPERLPETKAADDTTEVSGILDRIHELASRLESEQPGKADEFAAWLGEKKIFMTDLKDHQFRPVLLKLEKLLA